MKEGWLLFFDTLKFNLIFEFQIQNTNFKEFKIIKYKEYELFVIFYDYGEISIYSFKQILERSRQ